MELHKLQTHKLPNLSQLLKVQKIVTHKFCADGMASAMILHDALPDAEIEFLAYNTKEFSELKAKPNMLFCDFSPPEDRAQEFIDQNSIVLDHHKGVKNLVQRFKHYAFADEIEDPGISGANLAFQCVWFPIKTFYNSLSSEYLVKILEFQELAGIRDTFQTNHIKWNKARRQAEVLTFYTSAYWLNEERDTTRSHSGPFLSEAEMTLGHTLVTHLDSMVEKVVKEAYHFTAVNGLRCAVFQGGKVTSDAAEKLRKDGIDVIAGFSYAVVDDQPKISFSLRSNGKFNVAEFAQCFGGNGHTKAAGCSVNLNLGSPNPYQQFENMIKTWHESC